MGKNLIFKSLSKEELEKINGMASLPSYVNPKPTFKGVSSVYEAYKFSGGNPLVGSTGGSGSTCTRR